MYHNQSSKSTTELKRSIDDTCSAPHAPNEKVERKLNISEDTGELTDTCPVYGHKEFENVNDSRHSEGKQ